MASIVDSVNHEDPFHAVSGDPEHVAAFHAPSEEAIVLPRNQARHSIQEHMRNAFQKRPSAVVHKTERIKIVPYVDFRHVLGLACLVIWPVLLGIAFNIYGFEEVSVNLNDVIAVQEFRQRVHAVQDIVDSLVVLQNAVLTALLRYKPNAGMTLKPDGEELTETVGKLRELDKTHPVIRENHEKITPESQIAALEEFRSFLNSGVDIDPDKVSIQISVIIRNVRMFSGAYHLLNQKTAGITWSNTLQEMFQSEVEYRLSDTQSFGIYAYTGLPITERQRLTIVRRYVRILSAFDMYNRYALSIFQPEKFVPACEDCSWGGYRTMPASFWKNQMMLLAGLEDKAYLDKVRTIAIQDGVPGINLRSDAAEVFGMILNESAYLVRKIGPDVRGFATARFLQDYEDAVIIFAIILLLLIVIFMVLVSILGFFGSSMSSIFSESYRFQWIQLCRRRAIEREKSRSDKIVAEMFFEVNFKYLYEGTLPPVVLYSEATVAFVELMQYEELCKIYSTAAHVSLLDWYYHLMHLPKFFTLPAIDQWRRYCGVILQYFFPGFTTILLQVSNAVKGFNSSVVATAGHYCLLAGTHAFHAQNVALAMLRLMTMTRESFLPAPHNTRLPLIKAGMHTGSLAGAILSLKFPLFTMLGDTVNTASRMNSKSHPYQILLSEVTHEIVAPNFETKPAGTFDVKGKGNMKTFWLLSCNWKVFSSYNVNIAEAEELTAMHTLHQRQSVRGHARTAIGQEMAGSVIGSTRHSSTADQGAMVGIGGSLLQGLLRSKSKRKRMESKVMRRNTYKFAEVAQLETQPDVASPPIAHLRHIFVSNKVGPGPKESFKATNDRLSAKVDVKTSPNDSYYIQVSNSPLMRSWK